MIIGNEIKKIAKDPETMKHLELPTLGMKANLYSSVITKSDGSVYCLEQSHHNRREFRNRPKTSQKAFDMNLMEDMKDNYVPEPYFVDKEWAVSEKDGDIMANPTFEEMMEGLYSWQ